MKLKITTKLLKHSLNRISKLPGSSAIDAAIYAQLVRLNADMAGLHFLRFTNTSKVALSVGEVDVEDEGGVAVSHADFLKYMATMPGENTLLLTDDKNLYMSSGNTKARIAIITEDLDVDPPDEEMEAESIRMPIEDLALAISSVAPAACLNTDDNLYGMGLVGGDGILEFVAADRKKCLSRSLPDSVDANIMIGPPAIDLINRMLDGQSGACTLNIGEQTLRIESAEVSVMTGIQEKKFPNVRGMLSPNESSIKSKVRIPRSSFYEDLRNISKAGEGFTTIIFESESIRIKRGNDREAVQISGSCHVSEPCTIKCNSDDFAEMIKFLNSDGEGMVELWNVSDQMMLCKQSDRTAFVMLAQPDKK